MDGKTMLEWAAGERCEVINTQWLCREPAVVTRETEKRVTVRVGGKERQFWRESGLQIGYSSIVRRGDEPDRIVRAAAEIGKAMAEKGVG